MNETDTRSRRRIVGRLERGSEIPAALLAVVNEHRVRQGELRAIGILDRAELLHWDVRDGAFGDPRIIEGSLEVLQLTGTVSEEDGQRRLHLHLTASYETPGGIVVVGGHLQRGRVHSCEFVIEPWEDALTERAGRFRPVPPPSLRPQSPVGPVTPPPLEPPPRPERESFSDEVALPEPGDWIEHPQFGRCVFMQIDEDDRLVIRLPTGRLVQLGLGVVRLRPPREEDGKRVYAVEIRSRRR